jgi:tetratricopeptide (TPR) repeat protein
MQLIFRPVARAFLGTTALIAGLFLAHAATAQPQSSAEVWIAPASAESELESVARGFVFWLEERIGAAGVPVAVRWNAAARDAVLADAASAGASMVLFPELRRRAGEVEVAVLAYAPRGGLESVARARAPLSEFGAAAEGVGAKLIALLGVPGNQIARAVPPRLDGLAASGRAVRHRNEGELVRGWREVEGKLSPTAARARDSIADEADHASHAGPERARVLAVSKRADSAWTLVSAELSDKPLAEVSLAWIRAAIEVRLEQNNPREARRFLNELLRRDPNSVATLELLAATLREQNDPEGAAQALARAVEAGTSDPRTLSRVARDTTLTGQRRGRLLLQAGRHAAERLETHRAERLLADAVEMDPTLGAESWQIRAELRERLGLQAEALDAYQSASRASEGEENAAVHRGMGRTQHALGNAAAAEVSLRKAIELEPSNPDALHELGVLLAAEQRDAEALPLLERAVELRPEHAGSRRSFARSLQRLGEIDRAMAVLEADPGRDQSAETLTGIAALQRERGDSEAAHVTLQQAVKLAPHDPLLRAEMSELHEERNDPESARRSLEAARLLTGNTDGLDVEFEAAAEDGSLTSLDDFVDSFVDERRRAPNRIAFLGMRTKPNWQARLLDWLHPRAPNRDAILEALESSINSAFTVQSAPETEAALRPVFDPLYDFELPGSLDRGTVAKINELLGTDAVFVARFDRFPAAEAAADDLAVECSESGSFEIEARLLAGTDAALVSILANTQCLPGALAAQSHWNPRAIAIYAAVLLFLLYPLLRGWGSLEVTIDTPANTKGFFHIRIAKKASQVEGEKEKRKSERLQRKLRSFSRFERRMAPRENLFRWLPARRNAYFVTVRGPLIDAKTEDIIGHFLEEQTVVIQRGKRAALEYDFRPKECAVEVRVLRDTKPETNAQIAVRGDASSLRYARDGCAFLYLGIGSYEILIGSGSGVASYPLEIRSLDKPIPVFVDVADESVIFFDNCEAAVAPYLSGDLGAAADALEAGGHPKLASRVRAELHQQLGDTDRAAQEFQRAGNIEQAAELYAQSDNAAESAALFEQAGEHLRAADLYRTAGDIAAAGRCYADAYDFENAVECYRMAGQNDKVVELLEKMGQYIEAGELCREMEDPERALQNLEQVAFRDGGFFEARRAMAEILVERDQLDLAIEKLGGAVQSSSEEGVPMPIFELLAELLERAGRTEQLLETLDTIKRREPHRAGLMDRIDSARSQWEQETQQRATRVAMSPGDSDAATVAVQSRYEVIEEIGRGGMGVVLKAKDRELGRMVALKRLPENLRDHPKAVALFRREAQAAAALNHRNIVTIFDAGEEAGSYFITMELLEGLPLNAILKKRGQLSAADVARLGIQIAAGLHYAHEQRIVHRDIKTANLFFTRDKTVKIMDFGLAKTLEEVRRNSTVIGGTPYFMAPEQAIGGELDHRADLYAFGVTLFHLATGGVPFRDGDLAYHHRHTPAPDPRERDATIPAALAELILQLLEKEPDARPSQAGEVGARLQALISQNS